MKFWLTVVEKGRLMQWLLIGGGVAICISGGVVGYLESNSIEIIFLAMIAAAFALKNKGGKE